MAASLLRPGDIAPVDARRILGFLNAVADADALAETVGLSDGLAVGRRVGAELIAARPFRTLDAVLAVTGVTLPRFTEIAAALSGAQPPLRPDVLRFLPVDATPWIGRQVQIAAQLTDAEGRGVGGRMVTCVASDGVVSARSGLQVQTGSAIRLTPEPGGVIRFSYGPRLWPALDEASRAALSAELSRLGDTPQTPDEAADRIDALAARYRAQGASALRTAIDRLFETYDAQVTSSVAPWPVQPVTLLALTHDAGGTILQAASVTLSLRNWLGAFYAALRRQIEGDSLLPDALKILQRDAERGRDLSRQLIQATQGYSALERGVLGRRLRDAATGRTVTGFLNDAAQTLQGNAIVNTVRAAGASDAAIAAGGFAVFEAIRTVQEVEDTIKLPSKTDGLSRDDLFGFDQRLATLEGSAVTRTDLDRFRTTLDADVDQRLDAFRNDAVTTADLDSLRSGITADFDAKLAGFDDRVTTDTRFDGLDARVSGLAEDMLVQTDLDTMRDSITATVDTRLQQTERQAASADDLAAITDRVAGLEDGRLTQRDLDAVRDAMTEDLDSRFAAAQARFASADGLAAMQDRLAGIEEGSVTRADLGGLQSTMTRDFDAKLAAADDSAATADRFRTLEARLRGVESGAIGRDDLDALRRDITSDFDAKLAAVDDRDNVAGRFASIDARLAGIEETAVTQNDLGKLTADMTASFDDRLTTLEKSSVTNDDLVAVRQDIAESVAAQTGDFVLKSDVDAQFATIESDFESRLRTKANASTVGQIQTSLGKVTEEQTALRTDLTKIDTTRTGGVRFDPTRR
ncbi:hypothetical protein R5H30_12325 [Sulfitobacter sp. D35]|uniref:hypothetical protein n=1 Tax=Sulfitobacter sp. D35 TaxID=3083252 RepID=UPI00296FA91C|nr:hypothetical protein [Sulfitobacter sp. D35]MDW4498773.1 hypothetical protein [Sulfitobacter sp. D35]